MKKNQLLLGIYLPIIFILTAGAVTLRTVAIMRDLDTSTGYYDDKTLITFSAVAVVVAALVALSYLVVGDRELKLVASFDTPATYIPSATVAVALLFVAAGIGRDLAVSISTRFDPSLQGGDYLLICTALLALLAIVGFFLTSFSGRRESLSRAAFGIATVIFTTAYGAMLYFDKSMPMTAPDRIADLMAYVLASVFFLYEIRLSLGRDVWFAYISFGMLGACACAYSALPALIAYFIDGHAVSLTIYETVLTLALAIFMVSRVLLTARLPEDKDTPLLAIIKSGEERLAAAAEAAEDSEDEDDGEDVENYTFDLVQSPEGGKEDKE